MTVGGIIAITVTVCLLGGCAAPQPPAPGSAARGTGIRHALDTGAPSGLDHFVAYLPYPQAQTPTQARAMTHVAIGRAKSAAGGRYCNGAWPATGPVANSAGPYLMSLNGTAVWYYRISHRPGLTGCGNDRREALYSELEQELPAWLELERAATDSGGISLFDAPR